jgi:hypothetical protein
MLYKPHPTWCEIDATTVEVSAESIYGRHGHRQGQGIQTEVTDGIT